MTRAQAGLLLAVCMVVVMAGCAQSVAVIGTAGPAGAGCTYTSDIQVSEELARIVAETLERFINPVSGVFTARTTNGETIVIGYRVTLSADGACTAEYWPIDGETE